MIRRYRHKPEPHFHLCPDESLAIQFRTHPDGLATWDENSYLVELDAYKTPFYGVELEVESDSSNIISSLWKIIPTLNDLNFYIKTDSSLKNGLELVSHPRTYKSWISKYTEIRTLFSTMNKKDIWGSRPTCGLHIHIGYDSFMSISHISKFIQVLCELQPLIMAKEDRSLESIYKYCIPIYNWRHLIQMVIGNKVFINGPHVGLLGIQKETNKNPIEHHSSISCTASTLEVRMFKGTTSPLKFYRTIALLESLRVYTAIFGTPKCKASNYIEWLNNSKIKLYNIAGRKLSIKLTKKMEMVKKNIEEHIEAKLDETRQYKIVATAMDQDVPVKLKVDNPVYLKLLRRNKSNQYTNINISGASAIARILVNSTLRSSASPEETRGFYLFNHSIFHAPVTVQIEYLTKFFEVLKSNIVAFKPHEKLINKISMLAESDKISLFSCLGAVYMKMKLEFNLSSMDNTPTITKKLTASGAKNYTPILKPEIYNMLAPIIQLTTNITTSSYSTLGTIALTSLLYNGECTSENIIKVCSAIRDQALDRQAILNDILRGKYTKRKLRSDLKELVESDITHEKQVILDASDIEMFTNNKDHHYLTFAELYKLWAYAIFSDKYEKLFDRSKDILNYTKAFIMKNFTTPEEFKGTEFSTLIADDTDFGKNLKRHFAKKEKEIFISSPCYRTIGWPSHVASAYMHALKNYCNDHEALRRAVSINGPQMRPRDMGRGDFGDDQHDQTQREQGTGQIRTRARPILPYAINEPLQVDHNQDEEHDNELNRLLNDNELDRLLNDEEPEQAPAQGDIALAV